MPIAQIPIPINTLIEKSFPTIDYSDCFNAKFYAKQTITLNDCIRYLFYRWPRWIDIMMKIRNILVRPFGLDTGKASGRKKNVIPVITITKGGKIAFFDVLEYNNEEVLLYASDKHLDACLSILLKNSYNQYEISISTTVKYNNAFGKIYFFFVKPFHVSIVKTLLHRLVNYFTINQ